MRAKAVVAQRRSSALTRSAALLGIGAVGQPLPLLRASSALLLYGMSRACSR